MIHTPEEYRPASNDRHLAELALETQGWTVVKLPRDRQRELALQFIDMMTWCEDNIGKGRVEVEQDKIDPTDQWYSFSWYGYWNFWFRNSQDATAFTLRWA